MCSPASIFKCTRGDGAGRTDGTWSRTDFEWDAENNQYICSEGEALKQFRRNYSDPNRGRDCNGVAKYQALKLTCQDCPSKPKCCPAADARKITRKEHEDAVRLLVTSPKPNNTPSQRGCGRRSKCSSPTSNTSLGWDGYDYVVQAVQMTDFSSPQPPKISTKWPRFFPHRKIRPQPDKKVTHAVIGA